MLIRVLGSLVQSMRCQNIPVLMATQHPDSTIYVSASREVDEAVDVFTKYSCDEVMVDYEGKLTPYHQPEWIIDKCISESVELGAKKLITVRIPNDFLEDKSRHMHSLLTVAIANVKAVKHGFPPPICYVVLPMFEDTVHASLIQRRIIKLQLLVEEEMGERIGSTPMVVPLLETVSKHIRAESIAEAFRVSLLKNAGVYLESMRVFLGKSDAALENGNTASTLSLTIALSSLARWSMEAGIQVYPIIGMGKAPFRGFLHPGYVDSWIKSWRGYRTVTIQSALRYNTSHQDYTSLIEKLKNNADLEPLILDIAQEKTLRAVISEAAKTYKRRLGDIAPKIIEVAKHMPRTRDRLAFTIYGRGEEDSRLPRAITFTATCYTLGVPPTLLDIDALITAWKHISELPQIDHLVKSYEYDLSLYDKGTALELLPKDVVNDIDNAVRKTMDELGLQPISNIDNDYWAHITKALDLYRDNKLEEFRQEILRAAELRGFLG